MKLIRPQKTCENQIMDFKEEFINNDESVIYGSESLEETENYGEWLENIQNNADEKTLSEDGVLTDVYLGVRNQRVVGIVSVKHDIDESQEDSSHINYSVRPSCRCKGCGTKMVKQALGKAKDIGLEEVQVSIPHDNIGSIKVIEKNNAELVKSVDNSGEQVDVYQLKLE
ncbi:MAG: GNAT family N-acetyltransferase [Methanosphaera sp.]|nr:GNAT family N-acetyltransferase [Methanosphaera sp.]